MQLNEGKVEAASLVVVGDRDQVEHEDTLKEVFARFLPQATFRRLRGVGHLSPLEAPDALMRSPTPAMFCFTNCDAGCGVSRVIPSLWLALDTRWPGSTNVHWLLGRSESRAK
jgi:hypothetical protein